jgi:hypothetical protein
MANKSRVIVRFPLCAILLGWLAHNGRAQTSVLPPPLPGATSCSATHANWLTCTISGSTLTLGAATGQTSHQVIGTCGSATSFGPCALVAGDLPTPSGGGLAGTVAVLSAATGPIANVATQVIGYTVPSGTLATGTTYTIEAFGTQATSTSPGNDTFSVEIGASSLSGNYIVQNVPAATAGTSNAPIWIRASITAFPNVVSGSMIVCGSTTGAFSGTCRLSVLASATITAGQSNVLELVYQSGASTSSITFTSGIIKLERP